jgi:hypothetical protein
MATQPFNIFTFAKTTVDKFGLLRKKLPLLKHSNLTYLSDFLPIGMVGFPPDRVAGNLTIQPFNNLTIPQ